MLILGTPMGTIRVTPFPSVDDTKNSWQKMYNNFKEHPIEINIFTQANCKKRCISGPINTQ